MSLYPLRNLKKSEDSLLRTEKEIKENEKEIKDLKEELTMLEDKAAEVVNDCRQAEVSVTFIQYIYRVKKYILGNSSVSELS